MSPGTVYFTSDGHVVYDLDSSHRLWMGRNVQNAINASQVDHSLVLKIKTGSTEGTDLYTFNGSANKTLDIKAGNNVTLTAAAGTLTIAATNTTYSAMSVSEMKTGTATTGRVMRADYLKSFLSTLGGTYLTLSHDATNGIVLNHDASGVTAGTYGSATQVPKITVDTQGHITGVTATTITNSRDPGYGKIKAGTASTATTAITANTSTAEASTYNETLTINPGNKWIAVAASNSSTAGSDTFTIAHSTSGATAGNYGDNSNQTPAYGGTFNVPYISIDAGGHVTGISTHTVKIPASDNTDYKVRQTNDASTNANYRLLLSNSANDTQEDNISRKNSNLIYNPSTNKLSTGNLKLTGEIDVTGNAYLRNQTSADSLTAGSLLVNGNANFVQIPTAPTPADSSNDTSVATTAFVKKAFSVIDAMVFKGTLGTAGSVASLPTNGYSAGWTYRVATAGTYAGEYCEVGDLIIAITDGPTSGTTVTNAHWAKIEHNIDGAVYMGHAGSAVGSSTQPVYVDANGLVTASTTTVGTKQTPVYLNSGNITQGNTMWSLSGGDTVTTIANTTDIDTELNTPGVYKTANSTASQTLTGTVPITTSGIRIVTYGGYRAATLRQFLSGASNDLLYRSSQNTGSTWTKWYKFVLLPSGDDNKTFSAIGSTTQPVYVNSSGVVTAITGAIANNTTGNAATATKLATARTINGTSFDGSANITTANWGTARNISISDSDGTNTGTAVSVNGSAAVTLKLPATIKASLTGNASTATKATNDSDGNAINTTYIKKSIGTTKGDILYWSAASTPARLGIGSKGYVLKVSNSSLPIWSASPFHTALTSKGTTATTTAGETYGIAGVATGSTTTIYSKWFVNLDSGITTPFNGMIIQIKIPVAGVNAGCAITIDNGSNFYPVSINANGRLTTHFGANDTITLQFDSARTVAAYGTQAGASNGNATVNITGCWRVLDAYDSNTTYSAMSATEAWTGTATTSRVMTAANLKAILANLGGTGLTLTHDATNGIVLKHSNSIIAGTAGTSSATSGATLAVPYVTYDAQGHITATGTHTHTINNLAASTISSGTLDFARLPTMYWANVAVSSSSSTTTTPTFGATTISGTLTLTKTQDAAGTADNKPALIVGGASTAQHIEIDGNEILSKSDGTTPGTLYLQDGTGAVSVAGSGGLTITSLTASQAVSTDANKKLVSTNLAVSDPTASGTGITYIATISQSAVGKITVTKSTVRSASTSQTGVTQYTTANTNTQLNTLTIGSSVPIDADYYISQYVGGGTTTTTYHRRPMSALWSYIKGKITSDVPSLYWANVAVTSTAQYDKGPEVKSITIGNGSGTTAATKKVQMVYDATLEVLNFVFS